MNIKPRFSGQFENGPKPARHTGFPCLGSADCPPPLSALGITRGTQAVGCGARRPSNEIGPATWSGEAGRRRDKAASRRLEVSRSGLASAAIFLQIEVYLLTFGQARQSRPLDRRDMDEYVLAPVVRLYEAEAFGGIEPFHSSRSHVSSRVEFGASGRSAEPTRY